MPVVGSRLIDDAVPPPVCSQIAPVSVISILLLPERSTWNAPTSVISKSFPSASISVSATRLPPRPTAISGFKSTAVMPLRKLMFGRSARVTPEFLIVCPPPPPDDPPPSVPHPYQSPLPLYSHDAAPLS